MIGILSARQKTGAPSSEESNTLNSTHLITDLHHLASGNFTPETVAKASKVLPGDQTPSILVGIAVARAAELKITLIALQAVIDRADSQLVLVNSILSVLD